jgi:hypothetical protein
MMEKRLDGIPRSRTISGITSRPIVWNLSKQYERREEV